MCLLRIRCVLQGCQFLKLSDTVRCQCIKLAELLAFIGFEMWIRSGYFELEYFYEILMNTSKVGKHNKLIIKETKIIEVLHFCWAYAYRRTNFRWWQYSIAKATIIKLLHPCCTHYTIIENDWLLFNRNRIYYSFNINETEG